MKTFKMEQISQQDQTVNAMILLSSFTATPILASEAKFITLIDKPGHRIGPTKRPKRVS